MICNFQFQNLSKCLSLMFLIIQVFLIKIIIINVWFDESNFNKSVLQKHYYVEGYFPKQNCSNIVTYCKSNEDCTNNCVQVKSNWECVDNTCSTKSLFNHAECDIVSGGVLIFDNASLKLTCFCTSPEYYIGSSCNVKNPLNCLNGMVQKNDTATNDLITSYCYCNKTYSKYVKTLTNGKQIPICIPAKINSILKNQNFRLNNFRK